MSPADSASAAIALYTLALYCGVLALLWAFITHMEADSYADQRARDRAFWKAIRRQPHKTR